MAVNELKNSGLMAGEARAVPLGVKPVPSRSRFRSFVRSCLCTVLPSAIASTRAFGLAPSVAPETDKARFGAENSGRDGKDEANALVWGQASGAVVTISSEARQLGRESEASASAAATGAPTSSSTEANSAPVAAVGTPKKLSQDDEATVEKMKTRDRAVRAHEQAHKAVGGGLAGAVNLTLEQGPDGQSYAVGGSVPIDVTPVKDDPSATIQKMQKVQAAAMAPADPSGADQQVAAAAAAYMAQAMQQLAKNQAVASSGSQKSAAVGTKLRIAG